MGRPTQHNHPPLAGRAGGKVKTTRVRYAIPESHTRPSGGGMIRPGKRGGGHSGRDTPGLFPFRTRKLRLPAPMVLHPPGCGRVGHRRLHTTKGGPATGPPFFSRTPATHDHAHTQSIRAPATVNTRHAHGATPQKPHTHDKVRHTAPATVNTAMHTHGHTAPDL